RQYGLKKMYLGAPTVLGKNGVEKIIELKLNKTELKALHKSAEAVSKVLDGFKKMNID
ncbi:MAG TPA: malate dehydrogenase, partial [Saprospiraceae bacterium]|nr:malate dehydrogenase [Saprospiraceae bacterium]